MRTKTCAAIALLALAALPTLGLAQQDPGDLKIPSLDYQQVDVHEAIHAMFMTAGLSYSVAPDVQGTITAEFKNIPFETALQNILRQVDATYRIEDGVYQILHRQPEPLPTIPEPQPAIPTNGQVLRVLHLQHVDPALIALILSGKGAQNWGGSPEITSLGRFINPLGNRGGTGGGLGNGGFGSGSSGNNGGGFGGGVSGGFGNSQGGSLGSIRG